MADSEKKLFRLVSEFGRECERRKLRMNVGKSKVMRCSGYGNLGQMPVILNDKPLEEVDGFKYLGSKVAADGGCEMDVEHRMNEGYRAWGALKCVLSSRVLIKAKRCLYEGVIVPTALYGAEAWGMRSAERRNMNVLEMECLRRVLRVLMAEVSRGPVRGRPSLGWMVV